MNFTVTLSEAWDVIRRPFQASPLPRAALLRLLPVVLSAILLGQPAATVAREACPLPTPAGVECRGVGSRVEFDMLAPPAEPGLTFPRLNNVVLQVSWEPREEQPDAAEEAASLEHSA